MEQRGFASFAFAFVERGDATTQHPVHILDEAVIEWKIDGGADHVRG